MNLDSLSFALSQISYSVANLTKKNFKSSVTEISHVSMHFTNLLVLGSISGSIILICIIAVCSMTSGNVPYDDKGSQLYF